MHAPALQCVTTTRGRGLASTQQQAPQPAASTSGTPTTCSTPCSALPCSAACTSPQKNMHTRGPPQHLWQLGCVATHPPQKRVNTNAHCSQGMAVLVAGGGGQGPEEHTPGVGVALCSRADSTTASRLPHDKGKQHHAASAAPLCSRVVILDRYDTVRHSAQTQLSPRGCGTI